MFFPPATTSPAASSPKSRITLHLEAGATLWCSRDPGDYAGLRDYGRSGRLMVGTLLTAEGQEQIAVEGCAAIA